MRASTLLASLPLAVVSLAYLHAQEVRTGANPMMRPAVSAFSKVGYCFSCMDSN
jgi:hypothetical protein